jgi:glycosyltransferase involved in cell wall biosynthesis
VRYVWQTNQGAGAARNTGARIAQGEWLAFLDDDDVWLPTKLERQLEFARQHPVTGVVHTDHYVRDEAGRLLPSKEQRYHEARWLFGAAWRWEPWKVRPLAYGGASALGHRSVSAVRAIKRGLL